LLAKRLKKSDCSYFEPFFRRNSNSRQKAINLDQAKMRSLFPSLVEAENTTKYPVQVDWFFSDSPSIEVTQNITLSEKNWRLNSMPWVSVAADPGDIVVCQILGDDAPAETRVPSGVALALVRPGEPGYEWLDARLPAGGFKNLDDGELLDVGWDAESPVWQLIDYLTRGLFELVDDVIAGTGGTAIPNIGLRSIDRTGSTREAVEKLSRIRAAIGLGGETLVDALLERKRDQGEIMSYEWVSAINATAPVDFRAVESARSLSIEVKTTKGKHDVPFIISFAELREAKASPPYEIWRVSGFKVDDDELVGAVRRADPSALVSETLTWLDTSPEGVKVPGVEFAPTALTWTEAEDARCPVSRVPSENWTSEIDLAAS